jgi:hypothetical protein
MGVSIRLGLYITCTPSLYLLHVLLSIPSRGSKQYNTKIRDSQLSSCVNVDATICQVNKWMGWGTMIRDHQGSVKLAGYSSIDGINSESGDG